MFPASGVWMPRCANICSLAMALCRYVHFGHSRILIRIRIGRPTNRGLILASGTYFSFPNYQQHLISKTKFPGRCLQFFHEPYWRVVCVCVCVCVTVDGGFALDIWFIDHLYARFGSTSNYSSIANLHNSQITTAHAMYFVACCVFTSRSLVTASNSDDSSASALKSSLYSLRYRTDKIVFLITPRHCPCRQHAVHSRMLTVSAGICSHCPAMGCVTSYLATGIHATILMCINKLFSWKSRLVSTAVPDHWNKISSSNISVL
jgi:hypothetical protein